MQDLTQNETRAMIALIKMSLNAMGGTTLEDLRDDPFTWCDPSDLTDVGWSKPEANGTFGTLMEKGLVQDQGHKEWSLTTLAIAEENDEWFEANINVI